jgi:hypothetical protein
MPFQREDSICALALFRPLSPDRSHSLICRDDDVIKFNQMNRFPVLAVKDINLKLAWMKMAMK